ncbi:MAG: ATP-binding protein [Chloroflexota bacterium]
MRVLRPMPLVAGALSCAVGLIVIVGWFTSIPILTSFLSDAVSMKFNAALCFVFIGAALLLSSLPVPRRAAPGVSLAFCAVAIAISVITLFEYAFDWSPGIDLLIVSEPPGAQYTASPGRMPPQAAFNFILLSLSLVLMNHPRRRWWLTSQIMAYIVSVLGLITLEDYVFGVEGLHGLGVYTHIALPGAVIFLLLPVGILACHPPRGLTLPFSGSSAGGRMALYLLPAIVVVITVLNVVIHAGMDAGFFTESLGHAMLVVSSILILTLVISIASLRLSTADERRRRAENEVLSLMTRKVNELEQLDQMKTNMISVVSHELRTPLAIIKGYSTMLLKYNKTLGDEEKVDCLEKIDQATDRQARLVDHLIDLSRLEAGLLHLDRIMTSVAGLIGDAVTEARLIYKDHTINYAPTDGVLELNIDPRRIRQVIDNLINNAVKYSPTGTTIDVRVSVDGRAVLVSISDQGVGIPQDALERVFDRSFRAKERLSSHVDGLGLGLNLCRGLVNAHGGRIWVESVIGKGSTFYFTLPIEGVDRHEKRS